ncbi:MAG: ABC transporter substrate-binding protein [Burkholderiales bacterium]|nr:ABC transporter substrate-binding protein [Burkholderiales bacterium]MDE2394508.1 ABC transporter substrate-binding protein [Burkholderiales bacterium]MDE2454049.1 ABC transporter substrate-binding protein [Burkholderiales bacterium]
MHHTLPGFARMRQRLSGALSALALLAVPAGAALAQGGPVTVRFQDYPGFGNLLVHVAIAKGYCEQNGLKCEVTNIASSPLGIQAVMAGSVDSAFAAVDAVNSAILRGVKLKYVTGANTANVLELVAGNDVPTPNADKGWPAFMQDFKGKKIGVTGRGAPVERYMDWMLKKAGMDPEADVTYVAVGPPTTGYAALASNQVDALITYEPVGSICKIEKTCKLVWRASTDKQPAEMYALNGAGPGNVFLQDFIDRNPKVVDAVIRALTQADAFANDPAHFDEVLAISRRYFELKMPHGDEIMRASLHAQLDTNTFRVHMDRKAMKAALDMLVETGQLTKTVPVSDMVLDRTP